MDLHQLPPSPLPGLVNLIVEIPAGSRNKYEYSAEAGVMVLDRVMHSSVRYPFDYGLIPNTLAEDGSPLDAMVIMAEPTFAGCLIKTRPIGVWTSMIGTFTTGRFSVSQTQTPVRTRSEAFVRSLHPSLRMLRNSSGPTARCRAASYRLMDGATSMRFSRCLIPASMQPIDLREEPLD